MRKLFYDKTTGTVEPIRHLAGTAERSDAHAKIPGAAAQAAHHATALRQIWPLYLFLLPAIAYILIFSYYPMYGAQIAFREYRIRTGIAGSEWVGLKHIIRFITNYQFPTLVRNTLTISLYGLVANFVVRTVLALCLNCMRAQKYKKVIQTVTYMPHFISTVVMVGILIRFFNPTLGVISRLIQALGGTDRDLMGMADAIPHIYVWSGIWQNAGWSTILFLATLTAVDSELHEAAIIDGRPACAAYGTSICPRSSPRW